MPQYYPHTPPSPLQAALLCINPRPERLPRLSFLVLTQSPLPSAFKPSPIETRTWPNTEHELTSFLHIPPPPSYRARESVGTTAPTLLGLLSIIHPPSSPPLVTIHVSIQRSPGSLKSTSEHYTTGQSARVCGGLIVPQAPAVFSPPPPSNTETISWSGG
ncbi:hypothetical protein DFH08DRAFT_819861 [Mycena albidolilacea]|uniref:Uncharacterized protein n=1 Tax=Mycena albidolilacea TaxID=1033008 RepID=A0AAD6ZDX0_9AGAR|nr:hypothetical protein DFH08DRAFT_819861 [Mycena albidolilacea]